MGKLFKNSRDIVDLDPDDFEELKSRVYSHFGKPSIVVELPEEAFQYALIRSVQMLNTYAPKLDRIFKSVQPNLGRYTIYEYERVNSVLDVYVSTDYLIGLGLPIQTLLGIPMSFAATHNPEKLTNFVSLFSAYDLAKRMFGVQPLAELIEPNIVELTPIPYTETRFCFCITVNHDKDLGSLSEYEIRWLTDFCTATTGKMIGQIRRKYDGVTLPVGTLSTSGSSIYTESLEWEKTLLEELKSRKKFPQAYITVG
jgi:hypothetical protein